MPKGEGPLNLPIGKEKGSPPSEAPDPSDEAIGRPEYVHTDVHAMLVPKQGSIYAATDGGLFNSEDGGESWEGRNRGLVTTMFHNIAVARVDGEYYGGGMQDNGSAARIPLPPPFERDFAAAGGGDGGWMLYDVDDPARMITTAQHMYMLRLTDRWTEITPEAMPLEERNSVFFAPIARHGD